MLPQTHHAEATATLNALIRTLRDAEERFLSAAGRVSRTEIKRLLDEFSLERGRFASQLQWEVAHLGGELEDWTSLGERLLRSMRDLRSLLVGERDVAEIESCERGEEYAVEHYKSAVLKRDLPWGVADLVERQLDRLQRTLEVLRKLRKALATGLNSCDTI